MKLIIALEYIIKEYEQRISTAKSQLSRHNSGEEKLSLMVESSIENNLETHIQMLEKYKNIYSDFIKIEKADSYEHRRLRAAITRKKYYKYAKTNKKKVKYKENDEKIEAAMIIDELPEETFYEEQELFELSFKQIEKLLPDSINGSSTLKEIRTEFNNQIKNFTEENINSLELLNYLIPIVVFHLQLLVSSVTEHKREICCEDVTDFQFFPKYQDWWISQMWTNHLAYFALYRWKKNIASQCYTNEQKEAWSLIFNNLLFVKSLLSKKATVAFEYHFIFDSLLLKYAQLESELEDIRIEEFTSEIKEFAKNEDLLSLSSEHTVNTAYLQYKTTI